MHTTFADVTGLAPLLGTALIAAGLYAGARRAAGALDLDPQTRRRFLAGTAALIGVWVAAAATFGLVGTFSDPQRATVPPIAFGLTLPIAVVLVALARSATARRALAATPQRLLIGAQLYRVLGAVFLVLLAQGRIPSEFALPAGWGDVVVGVTAPVLAWFYRADSSGWRRAAVAWNVLGVLDLVVAVATGVLTAPGHWHRLAFDAPNTAITAFPYVLVPTVLVPVSLLLHAASLYRIGAAGRRPHAEGGSRTRPRSDAVGAMA